MTVPNAPCGVESKWEVENMVGVVVVPNAPCGVEGRKSQKDI